MSVSFLGIAAFVGAGSVALALTYVRRVKAAISPGLADLVVSLRRLPPGERVGELARRAKPGGFEHRLAMDLEAARSAEARVAAANEALADVELAIGGGAAWPRAAVRICASGTLLVGVIAFLLEGSGRDLPILAAIGGIGILACVDVARRARRIVHEQRTAVDALITSLLGSLPRSPVPPEPLPIGSGSSGSFPRSTHAASAPKGATPLSRRRTRRSGPSEKRCVRFGEVR